MDREHFGAWVEAVPDAIRKDALWRMQVYRLALYAADMGWDDVTALNQDRRTWSVADQLNRALGSISANIAEGYSRGSGRDRARFYEYALGSARESRDWYFKARHVLGDTHTYERLDLLASVIRQLLVVISRQQGRTLREPEAAYSAHHSPDFADGA
ncbi:MAG: four helix bundle protein [Bacteroidota bacterium]